ncbi:uncharacterized protein LOC128553491, partial [Mercenaria mercenaria]|uniref:uncharacterized protein LOC128553491 n=1 Tax=Mercenaria mercenaria TaxID=6596 RepID=UPI00234FA72F
MVDEADKNHGAESRCDETIGEGKMYELPGDVNCPVASFEKYLSKLNPGIDCLWQRPLDSFELDGPIWYCMAPLGKGKLAGMMGDISNLAHLSKRYTNHCIRATSISELDRNGIEARHLVRVSGHKSEMSIRSYSRRLCDEKQQQISDTLAKALQKKPNVTNINQQAPINQHAPNETATSGVDISDLDFLEEIFRDDNVFIELDTTGKENHPPNMQPHVSDKPVVTSVISQTSRK